MGCQCICSHKEPTHSQVSSPKTPSLFKYQGEENYSFYKVILIGDAETGKTSVLASFTRDVFNPTYLPTIGIDYQFRIIKLDEFRIKLQMWDTAGQARFRTLARAFYRGCVGIVLTYNSTKEETFENIPYWIEEISRNAHPDAKIILVGTNGDRVDGKVVDYTRARDFANERQIPFFEVSSKDGTNVELAFMTLVTQLRQLQIECQKNYCY